MKALDISDTMSCDEIRQMQLKRDVLIKDAEGKFQDRLFSEAITLYEQAQDLAYHAGEGLRVGILNEVEDLENWHELDNKIGQCTSFLRSMS